MYSRVYLQQVHYGQQDIQYLDINMQQFKKKLILIIN